ncbi:hypothetical protein REPUB_Repub07fG0051100 [Reevesia pubescens]
MDPDVVAKAFVEHYYSTFDAIQASLANLYQDGSMLTFEGQKIQGSQNFMANSASTILPPSIASLPVLVAYSSSFLVLSNSPGFGVYFGDRSRANLCFMLMSSMISVDSFHDCDFVLMDFSRYLHGNKLTGPIPPELGNMSKLSYFLGFEVSASICDVSTGAQRENLMEKVSSLYDCKLNILINNVGTNIRKPMVEFTSEEVSTLLATNFESVFNLCQLAYPLLKASGLGSVVFTSSVSGFVSLKSMSVQGATKGNIHLRRISWNADMRWDL